MQTTTESPPPSQSLDLLIGADKIAEYIYGDAKLRKRIYHLADNRAIPTFRLGNMLCARRSTIVQWIIKQERMATA